MAKVESRSFAKQRISGWDMQGVLEALRVSREVTHNIRHGGHARELPSPQVVLDVIEGLSAALFPTHLGQGALSRGNTDLFVSNSLSTALARLSEQLRRGLQFNVTEVASPDLLKNRAASITSDFAREMPNTRALLVADLRAAYRADPSANSIAEILLCYRGATAIIYHRIAHALYRLGDRLVARVISDLAHASTGIDIHPGARIGEGFFIAHGTGIVIGETAVIGTNVQISQGVTLGAMPQLLEKFVKRPSAEHRHPVIEDDVIIHAGATILGPVTVGRGSTIGGNVWLTRSVLPGSVITQAKLQAEPSPAP